jgi:hypothetical protein
VARSSAVSATPAREAASRPPATARPTTSARSCWPGSSAQRLNARDEFGEGEGFVEVVVGAEAEALDLVVDRRRRGEHEDARVAAAQLGAHVVAVHAGKVTVQHDDVVVVDGGPLEGRVAVEHDVDGHRVAPQPVGDRVGEEALVLNHQYAHPYMLHAFCVCAL